VFKAEEVQVGGKVLGDNKRVDVETLFEKSLHVLVVLKPEILGFRMFPTTTKISGFLAYQLAV
jgi:hypothetical protein